MHPRERIPLAIERWGRDELLRRLGQTLRLQAADPIEGDLLDLAIFLGERQADRSWTAEVSQGHAYWAQVWAARALLYVWDDALAPDVVVALDHPSWRVREMALKVVVSREIGCADVLEPLASDDVPRVRTALARALGGVGEAEHAPLLRRLGEDHDPAVTRAADRALARLARRVDLVDH